MSPLTTPNLVVAALGPFAELLGVAVLVALFTLLRGQAERRPYFKPWEESWVMLAVALVAEVIFQRLTDPSGVLYASTRFAPWLFGAGFFCFRLLSLALLVSGTRLFVSGVQTTSLMMAAVPLGLVLSLVTDTYNGRIGALGLVQGPFAVIAYAYAAVLLVKLPPSRRSIGSNLAPAALIALAVLWAGLVVFYFSARSNASLSAAPWFVRLERYGFYAELLLNLALAYAMVRLLFEDSGREAVDTRSQLDLLKDRQRLAEFYDASTGLLNRRAYDASVGMGLARATFGSVAFVRMVNLEKAVASHGAGAANTLLGHFAALLDHAVRSHDRVYRWDARDFLVVLSRTAPGVAKARLEHVYARSAPLLVAGVRDALRPEVTVAVAPFRGGEDLAGAVSAVAAIASPA